MGFFRFRKKKGKKEDRFSKSKGGKDDQAATEKSESSTSNTNPPASTSSQHRRSTSHKSPKTNAKRLARQQSIETVSEPTMEMLPSLVNDLAEATETSKDTPARALRLLFALSEHGHTENRTEMVRRAGGKLVPTLLEFLDRCERGSSEQYLTLLVLNNISIPSENKRVSGI